MLEKQFDANALYNRIVHYYMDKKGFTKDKANSIAQSVVRRESERRVCKNKDLSLIHISEPTRPY